ncbi:MAG: universal stress protein [Paracoccaceae bacterium]|nr:universal stress protein [Paracoccaceae bacterium]
MTYRTFLTYLDGDEASEARAAAATGLARQFDAHLTFLAIGYEPNIPPYAYGEAAGAVLAEMAAVAESEAQERSKKAGEMIDRSGIRGDVIPVTCRFGAFAQTIGDHAQFTDLTVLTQPYGETIPRSAADAFEGAMFDGDGAVLICPAGLERLDAKTVMIAWNGSREALRATRRAMPVLKQAERVELLMIEPPEYRSEPGHQMATMLSRHGVPVEVAAEPGTVDPISTTLRRRAREMGAGLIVMGGYGHSRFREYMIGGATRDIVSETDVPILMAH